MNDPETPTWSLERLGDLGSFYRGRGGTKEDARAHGLPCVRYGELYTQHDCVIRSFRSFISPESTGKYFRLQEGDIVFAGSGETLEEIGKAAAFCMADEAYAGADTIIFRPDPGLNAEFAGYAVNSVAANRYKARHGQGSSVMHISSQHLAELRIPVPPPTRQQRIAEILRTVDEAIEHTEALIAKTQQIKAGLMHDLFTRGVTGDGKLRPTQAQAPELYERVGQQWLPIGWEVWCLRDCLTENPTNGIYKPADQIGTGTLLIGQTAFTKYRSVDTRLARRAQVSEAELRRYAVVQGDILVSRVFATLEGVGQPTLVPDLHEPAVYESNMMRLRVDRAAIRPVLLFEWLRGQIARRHILGHANAANQASINQVGLNSLPVVRQPPDEQGRCVAALEGVQSRLENEEASLSKLRAQRLGLMATLLTGSAHLEGDGATDV